MTLTRGIYILVSFLGACLMSAAFLAGTVPAQSSNRPPSLVGVEKFSAPSTEGADVVGTRPDGWTAHDWMNSPELSLEKLRGKVVLVRWWTAPGCVFCEASAPALNDFWRTYRDRGLVVVGFYHHKSADDLSATEVKRKVRKLGFEFPVAIDRDWTTLQRWWLDKHDRGWTSVTFLLDRHGVIRHVHPGGAFFKGEAGYETLQRNIEALLAEPAKTS